MLKVILELEGERIVKSTPVLGFLHRGVEKLAEAGTYHQFIPHTDRLDYVCAMYNNFAYCRAVEKLMDMTASRIVLSIFEPLWPRCNGLSDICSG